MFSLKFVDFIRCLEFWLWNQWSLIIWNFIMICFQFRVPQIFQWQHFICILWRYTHIRSEVTIFIKASLNFCISAKKPNDFQWISRHYRSFPVIQVFLIISIFEVPKVVVPISATLRHVWGPSIQNTNYFFFLF